MPEGADQTDSLAMISDAIGFGIMVMIIGAVAYLLWVRSSLRLRAAARLADAAETDRVFVVAEAKRVVDELRASGPEPMGDHALRAATFGRLRDHVYNLDMPVGDEALWEAVDLALAQERPDPEPAKDNSAVERQEMPQEEAEMQPTLTEAFAEADGEDIVLLTALSDGRYAVLGESFDSADEAGRHLARELAQAYFPEWLETSAPVPDSAASPAAPSPSATAETPTPASAAVEGPWGHHTTAPSADPGDTPVLKEAPQSPAPEGVVAPQPAPEFTETPLLLDQPGDHPSDQLAALAEGPLEDPPETARPAHELKAVLTTADGARAILRPATADDAAGVAELANALDREVGDSTEPHTAETVAAGMLGGQAGLILWVVEPEEGGGAVGYALVQDMYDTDGADWAAWLHDLYINETWRRRNIGARLMAHLAVVALRNGHNGLWWGVHRNNWKAERFYRDLGAHRAPIYVMGVAGPTLDALAAKAA